MEKNVCTNLKQRSLKKSNPHFSKVVSFVDQPVKNNFPLLYATNFPQKIHVAAKGQNSCLYVLSKITNTILSKFCTYIIHKYYIFSRIKQHFLKTKYIIPLHGRHFLKVVNVDEVISGRHCGCLLRDVP